jgi:arsenate reductase (thioredoxin)
MLFLCTGNSARSILAEYLLRAMDPRFAVWSAGSEPRGTVHPMALQVLREVYGHRHRGRAQQALGGAAGADFVITLCDGAREICPVWPRAGRSSPTGGMTDWWR